MRKWKPCIVASRPGWQSGLFIAPNSDAIGVASQDQTPIIALQNELPKSEGGSLEGWQEWVSRYSRRQPLLKFVLAYALTPVLLEFAPAEIGNPIVELVGPSSTGKTTLANAAMSVWAGPKFASNSWVQSWNTTLNAIEDRVAQHAGTLLVLDEGNLLKAPGRPEAAVLASAVWMLAEGRAKGRKSENPQAPYRLCALSTSNQPLVQLLAQTDPDERQAIQVRAVTIRADGCASMGVWAGLPSGCVSPQDAVAQLSRCIEADHGSAGKAFAACIAERLVEDEQGFKRRLAALTGQFMKRVSSPGLSPLGLRRARTFSLIFAAGRLATELGILPIKGAGKAVIKCFEDMELGGDVGLPRTEIEVLIRRYISSTGGHLIDLDRNALPSLTGKAWRQVPGFLRTIDGERFLMVRKRVIAGVLGPNFRPLLLELKKMGRLRCNSGSGLQYQCRVRKQSAKDRVYAIKS